MIRRLRTLGRVLEFARCDLATAFVRRKPRSQAMPDCPDKPKFTGHRRHTGGILSDIKQFDAERHYNCNSCQPADASSEWPWAV